MALSSDLAAVFSLIQQQQALEERKEERNQELALQLLSMDVAQESRLKEVELQGTISEYYDLKKEREEVYSTLQKEYPKLQEKFLTDNFHTVKNTFEGVAEGDMSNLKSNMDQLVQDITGLESLERELTGQRSYYKGQEQAIAGLTRLVDPGEFETFVEEYEEKFPGAPTAGLYAEYEAGKVNAYQRGEAKEKMQSTSKAFAQSNWTSMRTLAADENFEEYLNEATENEVLQKSFTQMIGYENYPDFIKYINADQTGKIKDLFYDLFPTQMGALEGHVQSVDALESEFLGREKETHVDNITNEFLSSIADVKAIGGSNKEAFILYDEYQALLTNEADKKAMFADMEKQLEKGDLYEGKEGYKEHLDKTSKFDPKLPARVSLKEPVLESYVATDDKTQAEQIYEALDDLSYYDERVSEEGLSGREVMIAPISALMADSRLFEEREEWTPGKAMFGGVGSLDVGFDSPYYDAFYDEIGNLYSNLISEEDPFGPDIFYSGMPEEHQIPNLIRERYGDAVYESVYKLADEAGRNAQIKEIETVLKKRSGEDYWDLIRALDAIKE